MTAEAWANLDRLGRCCWYWSYYNRIIVKDLESWAPGAYRVARLERLDRDLPEVAAGLGLEYIDAGPIVTYNRGVREPYPWAKWSETERRAFESICGPQMDRLYPGWRDEA